ncbi:class I SAM-dependent methyltransferase [Bradyrhizobium sp. 31Argb]|uniref:class I SAM-dependent methyltransferase n=1 Tax=unclassified Bradyrhizobium TaxID=2631580 RepID=UPI00102E32F4|nr:class I SAM-dependent methyltransferase [Bradyrhizobium sp. Leo170]
MAEHRLSSQSDSPYDGIADCYDRARPDYPAAVLAILSVQAGELVADVGAGTGIFSRQLAQSLPDARVIGVEPGADMRRAAEAASREVPNLSFVAGAAEALPFPDDSLALVTAATAAHWFDRPLFYAEAFRCLRERGLLAIVQNVRRWWDSPFLAAYEELHEQTVQGYRRGTFPAGGGRYAAIDAAGELRGHPLASEVQEHAFYWRMPMTREAFVSFSLSSTITQRAIRGIGETAYLSRLAAILDRCDSSGAFDVPYVTRLVVAPKASPSDRHAIRTEDRKTHTASAVR